MKPCSIMRRRIEAITCERSTMLAWTLLAAQIEEAVFEPHLLGIVGLGIDRQRQRLGLGHDVERGDLQLDLAGRRAWD